MDREVQDRREAEEVLKRTLVTAQHAAEEAIAKARAKADELISARTSGSRRPRPSCRDRTKEIDDRIDQLRRFDARRR